MHFFFLMWFLFQKQKLFTYLPYLWKEKIQAKQARIIAVQEKEKSLRK